MTIAFIEGLQSQSLDLLVMHAERSMCSGKWWSLSPLPDPYSTDPRHAQPIIERAGIASGRVNGRWWAVAEGAHVGATGPTQLVACMRAYLASFWKEAP